MPRRSPKKDGSPEIDRALLIRLYHEQPLSVDKLAYTREFEGIVQQYNERHTRNPANHYWIYQTLVILRKNRKLVKKGKPEPTLF